MSLVSVLKNLVEVNIEVIMEFIYSKVKIISCLEQNKLS